MISFEKARNIGLTNAVPLPKEKVDLQAALGRFLALDVVASHDHPRFDNSSVDGFALQSVDTITATPHTPAPLTILATISAGQPWKKTLPSRASAKIMTGAPLPAGADAVEMIEQTTVTGDVVFVTHPTREGQYIRRQGEEYRVGDLLLTAGTRITTPICALLASLGHAQISVRRLPKVALITTGNEVIAPGSPLQPGQIYDANRAGLLACLGWLGIVPVFIRHSRDEPSQLESCLREAYAQAEVVLSTGGVSMGEFDYVEKAATACGLKPEFWKIALKPGKPTFFGTYPRREGNPGLFWGLPGNPVSAFLVFHTLVRPALEQMMGRPSPDLPRWRARLQSSIEKEPGRLELIRGVVTPLGDGLAAVPLPYRESHMLLGLSRANGLLYLPSEAAHIEAGEYVTVELFPWT